MQVIEAGSICGKERDEYFVRSCTGGGFLGSAGWHRALHKIGFVSAVDAIDRVVDRCVENGQSPRGYRRRRPASANGIERGCVPLDDYVAIGRSIREGTFNAFLSGDGDFAADMRGCRHDHWGETSSEQQEAQPGFCSQYVLLRANSCLLLETRTQSIGAQLPELTALHAGAGLRRQRQTIERTAPQHGPHRVSIRGSVRR